MKISEREMMLGVATLVCVLVGATWYGVSGKTEEWKSKKVEIEQLNIQIARHQAAIRMQDNWRSELAELEKDLRVFEPGQRSVSPELMKTIGAIAEKHGLSIPKTTPSNEKPTGDLFELGINVNWEGKLDALVGFLAELQQQGGRYDMRTLNINPVGNNTGMLKGNMVINCAYTRRVVAETPAAPPEDSAP